ncbi:MAG: hypothetical protein C0P74_003870 [Gammaproteobacteria bacterium]
MGAAMEDAERKRRIRRTAILLALLAIAVYVIFIALTVMRRT